MSEKAEFLQRIRTLRQRVGEIYPLIQDQEGEIIDGRHRLEACPDWVERKTVHPKDRYEKALIWFAAHERRRIDVKELKAKLITMAEELLKRGLEKAKIARQIAEDTGYNQKYVTSLLPAKYKEETKITAGKKAVEVKRLYKEEIEREVKEKKMPTKLLCPICGAALALIDDLLIPYHEAIQGK